MPTRKHEDMRGDREEKRSEEIRKKICEPAYLLQRRTPIYTNARYNMLTDTHPPSFVRPNVALSSGMISNYHGPQSNNRWI